MTVPRSNSEVAPLIVIIGPTASGKTELAVRLADKFPLEVISADSRQVYRGMNIGTAKPNPGQLRMVPHHLIDVVDPDENFSAADFEKQGKDAVEDIRSCGKLPFLVGGTGLYVKALTEGLLAAPSGNSQYRDKLKKLEQEGGEGTLYQALQKVDPPLAARLFPKDLIRIVRGLEVFAQTGKRLSDFQSEHGFRASPYHVLKLGLWVERKTLYERIDARAKKMIHAGLIEETECLLKKGYSPDLKAMQAIGYRESIAYLENRLRLDEMVESIQRETRRYAKRQMTWFGKDKSVIWLESPKDFDRILALIEDFILMKGMK